MGGLVFLRSLNIGWRPVVAEDEKKPLPRSERQTPAAPYSVTIRSIGGEFEYPVMATDLSETGLFLYFDTPEKFPFNPMSILEVWIAVDAEPRPIFCNGKIARTVWSSAEGDEPGIAIRIIQIDEANAVAYERLLASISQGTSSGSAPKAS